MPLYPPRSLESRSRGRTRRATCDSEGGAGAHYSRRTDSAHGDACGIAVRLSGFRSNACLPSSSRDARLAPAANDVEKADESDFYQRERAGRRSRDNRHRKYRRHQQPGEFLHVHGSLRSPIVSSRVRCMRVVIVCCTIRATLLSRCSESAGILRRAMSVSSVDKRTRDLGPA
jgi:hypothetical protein